MPAGLPPCDPLMTCALLVSAATRAAAAAASSGFAERSWSRLSVTAFADAKSSTEEVPAAVPSAEAGVADEVEEEEEEAAFTAAATARRPATEDAKPYRARNHSWSFTTSKKRFVLSARKARTYWIYETHTF